MVDLLSLIGFFCDVIGPVGVPGTVGSGICGGGTGGGLAKPPGVKTLDKDLVSLLGVERADEDEGMADAVDAIDTADMLDTVDCAETLLGPRMEVSGVDGGAALVYRYEGLAGVLTTIVTSSFEKTALGCSPLGGGERSPFLAVGGVV